MEKYTELGKIIGPQGPKGDTGAAGGTIVLQYMPHELVGNYFTAV